MCCQEMGEKEATVALFCPKAAYDEPKVRKVRRENGREINVEVQSNFRGQLSMRVIK